MKLDRPTVIRVAYFGVAVAFVVVGLLTGEATNGFTVAGVMLATWVIGEWLSRRGSALGDEMVGRGDERIDQISRDAALGTVYTISALGIGYMLYGFAQDAPDEELLPALVIFALVWTANYVFARWRPLGMWPSRSR